MMAIEEVEQTMVTKRGSARKARVFTVPTHLQSVPKAVAEKLAESELSQEGVRITLKDNETAYLVGALLDAKRAAEAERQNALAQGDTQLAATLANKSATLADLTTRIAQAITRRTKR